MRTAAYVRERLEIVRGLDFEDPASAEDVTAVLDAFAAWDEADCKAQPELAQECIEWLDEALRTSQREHELYVRAVRRLRHLCALHDTVPASFSITQPIDILEARAAAGQSVVSRGTLGGLAVAVKVLQIAWDARVDVVRSSVRKEAIWWRYLRHPRVVPFLGVVAPEPDLHRIRLVSQWMPNGTITSFLGKNPRESRIKYLRQVVEGLQFMHSFSLIHGDIKPPNVLIDDPPVARLTDFETTYSTSNTSGITRTATHSSVTEAYTAPEVELQEVDPNHPDPRSDIYSFALLVWHVYTNRVPIVSERSTGRIRPSIASSIGPGGGRPPVRPSRPTEEKIPILMWDTMVRGWSADRTQRPSLARWLEVFDELEAQWARWVPGA